MHASMVRSREASVSGWPIDLFLRVKDILSRKSISEFDAEDIFRMDRATGGKSKPDTASAMSLLEIIHGGQPGHFIHPAQRALLINKHVISQQLFAERSLIMGYLLASWFMRQTGYIVFDHLYLLEAGGIPRENDEHALVEWLERIHRAIEIMQRTSDPDANQTSALTYQILRLNSRQREVLNAARLHPEQEYSMESHQRLHQVAYATARADLYQLRDEGYLTAKKRGKAWVFKASAKIYENIRRTPTEEITTAEENLAPKRDWRVW